ncbi:hypothetical protein N9362_00220, partial [bacterium]|nr:hypothetical protein [bacterium]
MSCRPLLGLLLANHCAISCSSDDAVHDMLRWARTVHGAVLNPKIDVRSRADGSGRGLFVAAPPRSAANATARDDPAALGPSEYIVTPYPASLFLTPGAAVLAAPELRAASALRAAAGECLVLVMFLARERLRLQHARRTGGGGVGGGSGLASGPWDAYLLSLPEVMPQRGRFAMPAELRRALRRSPSARAWLAHDGAEQRAVERFVFGSAASRDDGGGGGGDSAESRAATELILAWARRWGGASASANSTAVARSAFRWAQRVVEARSWGVPRTNGRQQQQQQQQQQGVEETEKEEQLGGAGGGCALAPILDLMNHRTGHGGIAVRRVVTTAVEAAGVGRDGASGDSDAAWAYHRASGAAPLDSGLELLDDYDQALGWRRMCDLKLLAQYGFADADRSVRGAGRRACFFVRWTCAASAAPNRLAALRSAGLPHSALLQLRVPRALGHHSRPAAATVAAATAVQREQWLREMFGERELSAIRMCEGAAATTAATMAATMAVAAFVDAGDAAAAAE